ncbi:uncharacterized protein Z520_08602, partial [Fonsecaea multimorphosa CBS 102226]
MPRLAHNEYHIGWICALPVEMKAAIILLDEDHGIVTGKGRDENTYRAGCVHGHSVIIACLPAGIDGIAAAAHVAKDMIRTFEYLKFILLVGIGGGIPDLKKSVDIRLGDVVVSIPSGGSGGVVQYSKGKATHGGAFELKGALNAPPYALLTAITTLRAQPPSDRSRPMLDYLSDIIERDPSYDIPGEHKDRLFDSNYRHPNDQDNCDQCLPSHEITRQSRKASGPQIHYGIIASGDEVVKDPAFRDDLRASYGALCVEMEAAGLANIFPCLTVRGICDYADSHKSDEWHPYAAAMAAAWTKELLLYVTAEHLDRQQTVQQLAVSIETKIQQITEQLHRHEKNFQNTEYQECHRAFKLSSYEEQKNVNPSRADNTCLWVINNPMYREWQENKGDDLLWITADPGCGKSVLSKSLVDRELQTTAGRTCCYFFFKEYQNQDNLTAAFCALLHQLFTSQPYLLVHAIPAWQRNGDKLMQEVDELWRIFLAATADSNSRDVYCVLDAIDECRDTDRHRLIEKLAVFLADARMTQPRTQTLKILVTSRPYNSIQVGFQRSMKGCSSSLSIIRLRGEDENTAIRAEIDSVIRSRVAEMTENASLSPDATALLEKKLLNMRNRTYLWLSLVIDGIYEDITDSIQHDENSINSIIATLPKSVDDAYEKILNRVRESQRGKVRTIFHIIIGARRALSLSEMSLALGFATSKDIDSLESAVVGKTRLEKDLPGWCGLFVFIERSRIYLVHQTAKEFLICSSEVKCGVWKHSLVPADSARVLMQICLRAICWPMGMYHRSLLRKVGDQDFVEGRDNLVRYAQGHAMHHLPDPSWFIHLRDAKVDGLAPWYDACRPVWDRLNAGTPSPKRPERSLSCWLTTEYAPAVFYLFCQVAYLFYENGKETPRWANCCVTILAKIHRKVTELVPGGHWRSQDLWGRELEIAAQGGHVQTLRILIVYADVNFERRYLNRALLLTLENGDEGIVRILVDAGANKSICLARALLDAAERGHKNVVRALLDADADIDWSAPDAQNRGLRLAPQQGSEQTWRIPLHVSRDSNHQSEYLDGALLKAAE